MRVHCKVGILIYLVFALPLHELMRLPVFPDVKLSNAYLILRPFFRPVSPPASDDPLNPKNWVFGKYLIYAVRCRGFIPKLF